MSIEKKLDRMVELLEQSIPDTEPDSMYIDDTTFSVLESIDRSLRDIEALLRRVLG